MKFKCVCGALVVEVDKSLKITPLNAMFYEEIYYFSGRVIKGIICRNCGAVYESSKIENLAKEKISKWEH